MPLAVGTEYKGRDRRGPKLLSSEVLLKRAVEP